MKFGELLKNEREYYNLSVKRFSDLSDVSTAYISKLENGKRNFPTEKYLYNILKGFKKNLISLTNQYENVDDVSELIDYEIKEILKKFLNAEDSDLKKNDLDIIFTKFNDFYITDMENKIKNSTSKEKDIYENKVLLNKNSSSFNIVDKPFLDLEWLLTQNEYEIFYGRSYIFRKNIKNKISLNENDMFFYNTLDNRDIRTIKKLIDVYLQSKFRKISNSTELFNLLTNEDNLNHFDKNSLTELLLTEKIED
ncbi:helix-turn-helix domain-containing protein [Macrococcus epidermidis]|uniref:helix-turn-helix domain-containing protein n=1 Tax=Macrococcus epidermidis TaxID=1902580 RepID=UPI0020B87156|nr:helix-turn-helix transcriptional regulator [Macrococcus epidermidis]UTH16955.1 helix-turn-helix transcriptional regulator [Macrococcus epidermidis]